MNKSKTIDNKSERISRADHLLDCRSGRIRRGFRWMFHPRIRANRW